jgi:eukaryotic-like serine/threonine-protein kinase
MIGQVVSHYRILERLGGGGMGEVFKAEDLRLGRRVALKFLPPELGRDPVAKERFAQEARAASALDHPNICALHDIDETEDGRLFLAMAFYEGESLKKRLDAGPLPLDEALGLGEQVAAGLAKAHAEGIVHRDIKPANLMLTRDGVVKIVDFGLAKLADSPGLTRSGVSVGTPAYMSPEQARGEPVDQRSDLWSLGVVLYEMIAGRRPFLGASEAEALHAVLYDSPPSLHSLRAGVPAAIEELLRALLARDRSQRLPTAVELKDRIRAAREAASALSDAPTVARPGAVGTPSPRRAFGRRGAITGATVLAAVLGLSALILWTGRPQQENAAPPDTASTLPNRKMLVVLPFENLGPSEQEYFAAGITEELTSRLAAVTGLGVISRTSATSYDVAGKTMQDIGRDLGVEYVLEGTVRWASAGVGPASVRITPQLIRVADDTHLWAGRYDASLDDIFQVQSDIARHVVDELEVTLLERERRALENRPTENPEAHNAYLRGLFHAERATDTGGGNAFEAVERFEEAVRLDPQFALAWALLAEARGVLHAVGWDRSDENASQARRAVERALEIDPDLPRAHLALGNYHYQVEGDYARALEQYRLVRERLPSSAEAWAMTAYVLRRQGEWERSTAALEEAIVLEPRAAQYWSQLQNSYRSLRRYRDVLEIADRLEALEPDEPAWSGGRGEAWYRLGDPARARRSYENLPPGALATSFLSEVDLAEGKLAEARDRLEADPGEVLRYSSNFYAPKELRIGAIHAAMGDQEGARRAFERARSILEPQVEERPDDPVPHSALGLAYAGLGRVEEAVRHGRRGADLAPISRDALIGPVHLEALARIYAQVGEVEAALDTVEELLSFPGELSVGVLELDPVFAPLRGHPRYRRLVERHRPRAESAPPRADGG